MDYKHMMIDINTINDDVLSDRMEDISLEQSFLQSIRVQGVLTPIWVNLTDQNSYRLIAGRRRLMAARAVGLKEIPAHIYTLGQYDELKLRISENMHRLNLNEMEILIYHLRVIFLEYERGNNPRDTEGALSVYEAFEPVKYGPILYRVFFEKQSTQLIQTLHDVAIRVVNDFNIYDSIEQFKQRLAIFNVSKELYAFIVNFQLPYKIWRYLLKYDQLVPDSSKEIWIAYMTQLDRDDTMLFQKFCKSFIAIHPKEFLLYSRITLPMESYYQIDSLRMHSNFSSFLDDLLMVVGSFEDGNELMMRKKIIELIATQVSEHARRHTPDRRSSEMKQVLKEISEQFNVVSWDKISQTKYKSLSRFLRKLKFEMQQL